MCISDIQAVCTTLLKNMDADYTEKMFKSAWRGCFLLRIDGFTSDSDKYRKVLVSRTIPYVMVALLKSPLIHKPKQPQRYLVPRPHLYIICYDIGVFYIFDLFVAFISAPYLYNILAIYYKVAFACHLYTLFS